MSKSTSRIVDISPSDDSKKESLPFLSSMLKYNNNNTNNNTNTNITNQNKKSDKDREFPTQYYSFSQIPPDQPQSSSLPISSIIAHSSTIQHLIHELNTNIHDGLTENQAKDRYNIHGPNILPTLSTSFWSTVYGELTEPLILFLLALIPLYCILGEGYDGLIAAFVIFFTISIELYNEYKGERAVELLSNTNKPSYISTLRESKYKLLSPSELVPGDIILLSPGSLVPADGRLLSNTCVVDESQFTGENNQLIYKQGNIQLPVVTELQGRKNMIYKGSFIREGMCKLLVIYTGINSEVGQLYLNTIKLKKQKKQKTKLQELMKQLAKDLTFLSITICSLLTFLFYLHQVPLSLLFLTFTSLLFATIPEELPLLIKLVLSNTSHVCSKNNVLIKSLKAAENLGSISMILTDKTGTLTTNELSLLHISLYHYKFLKGGTEQWKIIESLFEHWMYSSEILHQNLENLYKYKTQLLLQANHSNKSSSSSSSSSSSFSSHPFHSLIDSDYYLYGITDSFDLSILKFFFYSRSKYDEDILRVKKNDISSHNTSNNNNKHPLPFSPHLTSLNSSFLFHYFITLLSKIKETKLICTIPYDPYRKRSSCIRQVPNTNRPRLSCRGSVTFLLPLCTTYLSSTGSISELTQEKIQEIEKQVNEENIKGIRVLGLAVRSLDQNQMEIVNKYKESLNSSSPSSASSSSSSSSSSSHPLISLESNFTFLGFFSFSDCLRVDAYYTIHKLRNAGIQIKCVSGDQLGTTTAIVQAVGINEKIENYHLGEYQEEENEDQYHYQNYNYDEEEKEEKKTQHRIIHVNSKPRASSLSTTSTPSVFIGSGISSQSSSSTSSTVQSIEQSYYDVSCSIYCQMTPLDKFKLIQTIHQQQPHTIVAMIGDSINDILAIQESDVGITIESNSNSSEELKQISHIILMKNKLNGLYECIKEGRRMIENLKKSICFYLICKLTLILLYIASFFNNSSSLPLQPLHIIILECFMDIGASIAFTMESCSPLIMYRPPSYYHTKRFLSSFYVMNIILYSLCMFMSVGSVYLLTTSSFIIVTEHIHTSHNMLLKPDIQLPNVSFGSNITYLDEIINQTNSIIDNTQSIPLPVDIDISLFSQTLVFLTWLFSHVLLAHSLNSIEHTIIGSKLSFQQEKIKEKKQYEEILIERQAKYREFEGLYQNTNSLAAEDYSPSSDIVDSSIWSILGFSNISLLLWTICVILFALLLIYFSFIRDLLHFSSLNYLIVFIIPICHEQYHFSCYAICLPLFTSFIMFILLELGKWIYHCQHNIKPRY